MAKHNLTGQAGEQMAADYLLQKGYTLVERNYRYKKAEVDLIAQQDNVLVFVEVKTRKSNQYGFPEEAVHSNKIALFLLAADEYIHQHNWQHDIRFDIIAIIIGLDNKPQIHHIPDAFH